MGLAELMSLSLEEAPEGLSPRLMLMLASLRLGCNEAGSVCVGQPSVGFSGRWGKELPVLRCSSVTRVVLKGAGDRQEGGSPLLLPSAAISLWSPAGGIQHRAEGQAETRSAPC